MKTGPWIIAATVALAGAALAHQEADAFDRSFGLDAQKGWADRFHFGSYGELHGRVGDDADNIDMHRLVGMMSVDLTRKLRFVSELEFEHVFYHEEGTGREAMQIEVEQAYFEYALADDLRLNLGIQLVPIGIMNQTHEPTTFYGVERPNVEKYIAPSTWWENGIGIVKTLDSGWQFDLLAHTALDMEDSGYIRSGRPKLDLTDYTEKLGWAVTGRAKYTGIKGVVLASSLQFQNDTSSSVAGDQSAYYAETHAIYRNGGFELRALASYWNVDGYANPDTKDQWGYYIEPSYYFNLPFGRLGAFTRFSQYEYFTTSQKKIDELTVGINYWPTDEIVIKMDYQVAEKTTSDTENWNFGIGYYF